MDEMSVIVGRKFKRSEDPSKGTSDANMSEAKLE